MSLPDLFSALADPTRLRVLEMLHEAPRPVHELAAAFDISRPAISRHLRVLKQAGLVREEKQGRENRYSFRRPELKAALKWLALHEKAAPARARPTKSSTAGPVMARPAPQPAPVAPAKPSDRVVVLAGELAAPPSLAEVRRKSEEAASRFIEDLTAPAGSPPPPLPASPPPPRPASPQLSFFDL